MNAPVVSVVVPAYNAAGVIARAIDSVLGQTFRDFELLVVDDGSTDDTRDALARYGDRVRSFGQANAGPAAARNHGLRNAQGEFVAFLDADDYWLPQKLERQVAALKARDDIGFCSTATTVVNADGTKAGDWTCCAATAQLPELLFMQGAAISGSTSGVMARTALVRDAGGFDERLRGFEDPDLWIRLSARAGYLCLPQPLTVVVRTPSSVSTHLPRMRAATLASLRKNRTLLPPARRGAFWRAACAGAVADYAAMAWRAGDSRHALAWAAEALMRAPIAHGWSALGLIAAVVRRERPS